MVKKKQSLLVVLLCAALLFCGCSSKSIKVTEWSDPVVLKDDEGNVIELPENADDIISFTKRGILFIDFTDSGADFFYYQFDQGNIIEVCSLPQIIFWGGDVIEIEGNIYFCAREGYDTDIENHLLCFNDQTFTLEEVSTDSYNSPYSFMCRYKDELVICRSKAGDDGSNIFEVQVFDPIKKTRTTKFSSTVDHTEKEGVYYYLPIVANEKLYLFGGRYSSGELVYELAVLDKSFSVSDRIYFPNEGHDDPWEGLLAASVNKALFDGNHAYLGNLSSVGVIFHLTEAGTFEDFFSEMQQSFFARSVQTDVQKDRLVVQEAMRITKVMRFGTDTEFTRYQGLGDDSLTGAWQYDDYALLRYVHYSGTIRQQQESIRYLIVPINVIFEK